MPAICVCVGVRNRSEQLLKHLVPSLAQCASAKDIALSVLDCRSTDVPELAKEIRKIWTHKLYFKNSDKLFTRSSSINNAVKQSKESLLFLCDADISLPSDFVDLMKKNVKKNQTWYPICFSLFVNRPKIEKVDNGRWRKRGFGLVGIHREKFKEIKGYSETFKSWGGEDTYMFTQTTGIISRTICKGLFHNWHSDDLNYKNKWYNT